VLLHGRDTRRLIVKPPVMAKDYPVFSPNDSEPFIIRGVLLKAIGLVVMVLDGKRGLSFPKGLWKAFAEATVKIER
jgi:hypothetical protein